MLSPRTATPIEDPGALGRLRLRVEAGAGLDDPRVLPPRARRVVTLATDVGAPLLAALDAAQAALDDVERARRAVQVASAQARTVAIGLIAAPFVLVPALGRLTGADLVAFYTSGLGGLVLAVGLLLIAIGSALVLVLVRRVGVRERLGAPAGSVLAVAVAATGFGWWSLGLGPGLIAGTVVVLLGRRRRGTAGPAGIDEAADLVATALCAGVNAPEALRLTADRLPALADRLRRAAFGLELGMPTDVVTPVGGAPGRDARAGRAPVRGRAPRMDEPFPRLIEVLQAADEFGAPSVPTLRRLAVELRADDLARVLAAAERLPVLLTFPTALCLLPATVLLVGAPIVHAGFAAAGA